LGYAGLVDTTQAISDFADVCLRMALQIASEEQGVEDPPFAIIAMGKLGGQELNYSSDIDLIFVHGSQTNPASPSFNPIKLAEAVRDAMARVTDAGFVFRVDLRLRPEGRFGPISRSLESCRAYYESWGEAWERQALIKARFVAGDPNIGGEFIRMAEDFAYRSRVEDSFIESIRENKRRMESKIAFAGESESNVKEGIGGIRDIEFTAQLLQLIAGGKNPDIRARKTVLTLERLQSANLLTAGESRDLTDSYLFLRDVEHRLQILDELPIRCIPSGGELHKFGRRLGYGDGGEFLEVYRKHTRRVRGICERLFYDTRSLPAQANANIGLTELILDDANPQDRERIMDELSKMGFRDPQSATAIIEKNFNGSEYGGIQPGAKSAFLAISDEIIRSAAATSDPDAAISGINALAEASPSRMALFRALQESQELLPRLSILASDSPYLWQILLQRQELFDLLAGDVYLDNPITRESLLEREGNNLSELAHYIVKNRLILGARDIWKMATLDETLAGLTSIGEHEIKWALSMASEELRYNGEVAVIGMGKLGGAELGYGSDLDVLYVADSASLRNAMPVVKRLQQILKSGLSAHGISIDIDARLRPDGRKGNMALDIDSYKDYWRNSAATWERQAMIKARFIAGSPELGKRFMEESREFVYGRQITDEAIAEIIAMKKRIEKERVHETGDVKLAHGGLSDIEWVTQIHQLKFGHHKPRLRKTGTLKALTALRDDARIQQADWEVLDETYRELTSFRNRAFLKHGVASASEPIPEPLGRLMGLTREVYTRLVYFTPPVFTAAP
jgi:glutamate-ammonia-ligase adenylyltransferase